MYSRCVTLTSYIQQAQIFLSLNEHSARKLKKQEMCIKEKKAFQIKTKVECMPSEKVTARKG